jgi:gamma-glutamylcyclotransferase (GGCT)/AIG2-like uncharacterized protein YtfP
MKIEFLFVYGTLRRKGDSRMHRRLARHGDFVDQATYQGRLYRISRYPGVVASDDPADRVHGEVYRLRHPDLLLSRLDKYEETGPGFRQPTEYVRLSQQIRLGGGRILSAWVYVYNRPVRGLRRLPGGDFHGVTSIQHQQN